MVTDKRRLALVTAAAVVAVVLAVMQWRRSGPETTAPLLAQSGAKAEQIPWIDLDRAKSSGEAPPLSRQKRNIFQFVMSAPPPSVADNGGMPGMDPNAPPPADTPEPTPTPEPPPPPMAIKFIGLLEPKGKSKIAVLMSEQKEVMHGREGDVLGGRYRIVKIGLESVDMQDVTTGQSQRIALRGN
jgi:hypothetical protein